MARLQCDLFCQRLWPRNSRRIPTAGARSGILQSPRAHFLCARSLAPRQPEPSPERAGSRLFSGGGSVAIYVALHDEANTSFLFAVLIPLLSPGASQERRLVGLSRPCSQCRALSSAA